MPTTHDSLFFAGKNLVCMLCTHHQNSVLLGQHASSVELASVNNKVEWKDQFCSHFFRDIEGIQKRWQLWSGPKSSNDESLGDCWGEVRSLTLITVITNNPLPSECMVPCTTLQSPNFYYNECHDSPGFIIHQWCHSKRNSLEEPSHVVILKWNWMRHKRKSAFRSQIKDQFRLFVNVVHERSRNCFPFLVLRCNDSGVCCFLWERRRRMLLYMTSKAIYCL